jgi:hypothetical protein
MQSPVAERALADSASCEHQWKRLREVEDELSTVVYVRRCEACGRVEAKAGHKAPLDLGGWETIEG